MGQRLREKEHRLTHWHDLNGFGKFLCNNHGAKKFDGRNSNNLNEKKIESNICASAAMF